MLEPFEGPRSFFNQRRSDLYRGRAAEKMLERIRAAAHAACSNDRKSPAEQLPERAHVGQRDRLDDGTAQAAEPPLRLDDYRLPIRIHHQRVSNRIDEREELHAAPLQDSNHLLLMSR